MKDKPYFLGIDVGTQGVRVVLIDSDGVLAGSSETVFPLSAGSREEQSPEEWWKACLHGLKVLLSSQAGKVNRNNIVAVSVTSTSGTVIPLDQHNSPLHSALMYSDTRSAAEGKICREIAEKLHPEGYTGFNASSGLSKMVWYVRNYPDRAAKIKTWVHAADYISGKLSGEFRTTDYTNALKSGFDVSSLAWPDYLFGQLPLKRTWFQEVVPSGKIIGELLPELAALLGLPAGLMVAAGMTDGCASQVASGATSPGDWNTTIGTTLVIKGVTQYALKDSAGRFYNHRHPDGYWMPGGASNTGADWITEQFSEDLIPLTTEAAGLIPTGYLHYPLRQKGERFPFVSPGAAGFSPDGISRAQLFTSGLEGVAYLERYAYELTERLSGENVSAVYTAGGGSNSDVWLRIRASVLNRPVVKCAYVSGAVGAAIVAASTTFFSSLTEASKALTRIEKKVVPDDALVPEYEEGYQKMLEIWRKKGYID